MGSNSIARCSLNLQFGLYLEMSCKAFFNVFAKSGPNFLQGMALTTCLLLTCCSSRIAHRTVHQEDQVPPEALDASDSFLVLSGGGSGAVYGSEILSGFPALKRQGVLPQRFDATIGVSMGAIQLPYAYLGEDADFAALARFFNEAQDTRVLYKRRLVPSGKPVALASLSPFLQYLEENLDDALIDRVAKKRSDGAGHLLCVTRRLSDGEPIVWNLTRLAERKDYDGFRKVILASCAVSLIFDPVRIAGEPYVDGAPVMVSYIDRVLDAKHGADVVICYVNNTVGVPSDIPWQVFGAVEREAGFMGCYVSQSTHKQLRLRCEVNGWKFIMFSPPSGAEERLFRLSQDETVKMDSILRAGWPWHKSTLHVR